MWRVYNLPHVPNLNARSPPNWLIPVINFISCIMIAAPDERIDELVSFDCTWGSEVFFFCQLVNSPVSMVEINVHLCPWCRFISLSAAFPPTTYLQTIETGQGQWNSCSISVLLSIARVTRCLHQIFAGWTRLYFICTRVCGEVLLPGDRSAKTLCDVRWRGNCGKEETVMT